MTTFTYTSTVSMTSVATTINSNLLTVAASAAGSWAVAIGATLSHANIPAGTTILSYNSGTQAVMSANATVTGSGLTVTATNPTNINIDQVPGILKTGGDIYNISGPTLTFDQDSRFGLNENNISATNASNIGAILISSTLGGTVEVDSRYIRLIPIFITSGVLTPGATISIGGATGKAICLHQSLITIPTYNAGSGVTAFLKIKQWNEVAFPTSGSYNQGGLTFDITGPDVAGFMFINGNSTATITVTRLGLFRMRGTYYEIGTVQASERSTTYQVPTLGTNIDIASIEVETANGSGIYETYVCANIILATATTMATDWRGKVFWLDRTTGILRFGHDGTNLTGGYLPETGCKIRMYNLIAVTSIASERRVHANQDTVTARCSFITTGGGVLSFDKVQFYWYLNFSQPYSISMTNVSVCDVFNIAECATVFEPNNLVVSPAPISSARQTLAISLMPAGINFTDCKFVRFSATASGNYACVFTDLGDTTLTRTHAFTLTAHANVTTGSYSVTRAASWTQNAGCIGQRSYFIQMSNLTIDSPIFYDDPATATKITYGRSAIVLSYVTDFKIDGWDNGGLENCQPYASLINISGGCKRGIIQNIGTYASPLTLGGNTLTHELNWTRSAAVATVTHLNHGLITGNSVNVLISSDVAAIVVGQKSITVTSANTYTFTCLSAGAVSGTLSARQSVTGLPISTAISGSCSDITIRRIYFVGGRGTTFGFADNSCYNYNIKNVYDLDYFNSGNFPMKQSLMSGTSWTGTTTGVSGQYGTFWFDHNIYGSPSSFTGLTYTRVTTVATVTHTDHGLRTGAIINVLTRTDTASIPQIGPKTITVLTKDTYTFAVTNAGTASGTISIAVANSRLQVMFNEPTTDTTGYVIKTGNAKFTSTGQCLLAGIGDAVEFITPEFIKGYSSFTQNVPVMIGGTLNNYVCTYDIDTGSGFSGDYKNLSRPQQVSGTSGQYTLTVQDSSVLRVGDAVFGTNIAGLAKISTINTATQVSLNLPHAGTISNAWCQFSSLHNETISSSTGFKMRWKFTRLTAGIDAITFLYTWMNATTTDMQVQYPIPGIPFTITGLVAGSDVVILEAGTSNILDSIDSNGGSSYTYSYTVVQNIDIGIIKPGYVPLYIRNYALSGASASIPVSQQIDRNYIT